MPESSPFALKEWAVVCEALAAGKQTILFRKGGIHEGPDGFQPEHQDFWLFPTGFHQSIDGIRQEFHNSAARWALSPPAASEIPIQHFCSVKAVHWIDDEKSLVTFRDQHVLTDQLVLERFHYRQPGIYLLQVETKSLSLPRIISNDPRYDGCRSWVRLNDELTLPA